MKILILEFVLKLKRSTNSETFDAKLESENLV